MILQFLFRLRIGVLVLFALGTAAAAFFAFHGHAVPVGALFLTAASLLVGAIVAFACLRHAALALLVALAPLPGMIAAGPFALAGGLAFSGLLAVYGFGYLAAACLAGDILRRVLDGEERSDAARGALAGMFVPLAAAMAVGAALVTVWLFRDAPMLAFAAAAELAAAVVSLLIFVPFGAALLPFGETFFVTANRARERRETLLRFAALVTEARWGMSLGGVTLVLATLGGFGAEPLFAHNALLAQPALWGASALLVFLVVLAVGREWRDALATTLALATLALLSLVLWGRVMGHLTLNALLEIALTQGAALFLMLALACRSHSYRKAGDTPSVACLRAVEDPSLTPWFGALGAAGVTAPWIVLHGSIATLAIMLLLAGLAGLVAMPALATALHTLIPRRRSVEELYGRG